MAFAAICPQCGQQTDHLYASQVVYVENKYSITDHGPCWEEEIEVKESEHPYDFACPNCDYMGDFEDYEIVEAD